MITSINNLFSIIKTNSNRKKSNFYIKKNKKISKIIHLFYKKGLIKSYIYDINLNKYIIYLKYRNNNSFIKNIINISKSSFIIELSSYKINKIFLKNRYNYLLINSSQYGYDLIENNININNYIGAQIIAMLELDTSIYNIKRKHNKIKKNISKHIVI